MKKKWNKKPLENRGSCLLEMAHHPKISFCPPGSWGKSPGDITQTLTWTQAGFRTTTKMEKWWRDQTLGSSCPNPQNDSKLEFSSLGELSDTPTTNPNCAWLWLLPQWIHFHIPVIPWEGPTDCKNSATRSEITVERVWSLSPSVEFSLLCPGWDQHVVCCCKAWTSHPGVHQGQIPADPTSRESQNSLQLSRAAARVILHDGDKLFWADLYILSTFKNIKWSFDSCFQC